MFGKTLLVAKLIGAIVAMIWSESGHAFRAALIRRQAQWSGTAAASERTRNIVIVGASFAGSHAARRISQRLPPKSPYRVVVIEPHSHFHFTWLLPRFCVVKGHEEKAFIPYGGYVADTPEGSIRWIADKAASISRETVSLEGTGENIPYDFLVIATGSAVKDGLPSRVNAPNRNEGMQRMRAMQDSIEAASAILVIGAGAAGVEVATDIKSLYPDKKVMLVHSRTAVMHRFGKSLQDAAQEGLDRLGVETILQDRVVNQDAEAGTVTLMSGRVIMSDYVINCAGQKPASDLAFALSPKMVSSTGHILVKNTLQVADEELPNVYACGDVAEAKLPNPNARCAMRQAAVVAENILQAVHDQPPMEVYNADWTDGVIKLTLGLDRSVSYIGDGVSDLMFGSNEKDITLMAAQAWKHMGQKPYDDRDGRDLDGTRKQVEA
ncbi:hypothetical protein ACJ41O_005710 [Fusarium nematophilum]